MVVEKEGGGGNKCLNVLIYLSHAHPLAARMEGEKGGTKISISDSAAVEVTGRIFSSPIRFVQPSKLARSSGDNNAQLPAIGHTQESAGSARAGRINPQVGLTRVVVVELGASRITPMRTSINSISPVESKFAHKSLL